MKERARYRIVRTKLEDGRYTFRLVDTHDGRDIWVSHSITASPFAPEYLRKLQARYNSRYVLDKLHIY